MNLKTFVKVGSITNLSDARFCAGFGVDLLGFDLDPDSDNYISLDQANEIMGWVAGPAFVAEFGDMQIDKIIELQEENNFPFVQVNGLDQAQELMAESHKVILNVVISSKEELEVLTSAMGLSSDLAHIIVDCKSPELIPAIEEILAQSDSISLLKAYDVELSQLEKIISSQSFSGIELKGSQEEKAGFKEYDELADILEALETED